MHAHVHAMHTFIFQHTLSLSLSLSLSLIIERVRVHAQHAKKERTKFRKHAIPCEQEKILPRTSKTHQDRTLYIFNQSHLQDWFGEGGREGGEGDV